MAEQGARICGEGVTALFSKSIYAVDGDAWLITYYHATLLGKLEDARQMFPKLFA